MVTVFPRISSWELVQNFGLRERHFMEGRRLVEGRETLIVPLYWFQSSWGLTRFYAKRQQRQVFLPFLLFKKVREEVSRSRCIFSGGCLFPRKYSPGIAFSLYFLKTALGNHNHCRWGHLQIIVNVCFVSCRTMQCKFMEKTRLKLMRYLEVNLQLWPWKWI